MLQTAIRDKETDSNLYKRLFTNLSFPSHFHTPCPTRYPCRLHTVVNKPNEPCKIDWVVSDVFQVAPGVRRARIRRTLAAAPAWLMLAILTPNSGVWRKRFLPVCNRTRRKKHKKRKEAKVCTRGIRFCCCAVRTRYRRWFRWARAGMSHRSSGCESFSSTRKGFFMSHLTAHNNKKPSSYAFYGERGSWGTGPQTYPHELGALVAARLYFFP